MSKDRSWTICVACNMLLNCFFNYDPIQGHCKAQMRSFTHTI